MGGHKRPKSPQQKHEAFREEMAEHVQDIQRRYLEKEIHWRQDLIEAYSTEKSVLQSELDSLSTPTKDAKVIPKSKRKKISGPIPTGPRPNNDDSNTTNPADG